MNCSNILPTILEKHDRIIVCGDLHGDIDALKKILPDAWISNKEVNANAFLKWIEKTTFYELNYSDNNKLIDIINSCFLDLKKE